MNKIKKAGLWVFYTLFLWIVPYWYRFTMFLTKSSEYPVKTYSTYIHILDALSYGSRWTSDPLGGALDNLYHPTRVQEHIKKGEDIGDCDDHAVYWATTLLKSKLARRAWISFYQYQKNDTGQFGGHVICVFESKKTGELMWVDYHPPLKMENRSSWIKHFEKTKNRTALYAAEIPVIGLHNDDTPILGKPRILLY